MPRALLAADKQSLEIGDAGARRGCLCAGLPR